MKKSSSDWPDGLAKNSFIFECKLALDKIQDIGRRLEELYEKTDDALHACVYVYCTFRTGKRSKAHFAVGGFGTR